MNKLAPSIGPNVGLLIVLSLLSTTGWKLRRKFRWNDQVESPYQEFWYHDERTPFRLYQSHDGFPFHDPLRHGSRQNEYIWRSSVPRSTKLFSGRPMSQFTSMQNGIRASGITCWLEVIQLFLRSYSTPNVISDVAAAVHKVPQLPTEEKSEYASRQLTAFSRRGNVHDEEAIIVMLINGDHSTVDTPLCSSREERHREEMTFARLTLEAQYLGINYVFTLLSSMPDRQDPHHSLRLKWAKP